jgi:thiamine pyrophosphate-dependent acetolactate synthase large subunit-like protein/nitrite reductase/ring-hydroxylating ferredoxin subunit
MDDPTPNPSTEPVPLPQPDDPHAWHRVLGVDELVGQRVTTVTVGRRSLCVTRVGDAYGALDNACPHQGGPLGEGSIERGWLRCPWHGYDYSPCNGKPPPPFSDGPPAYAVDVRDDGVYVALPPEEQRERTVSDVLVETMTNWGVRVVFGMVGHSNLGFADAMRAAEGRGDLRYVAVRHEGAAAFAVSAYGKLTGEAAACFAIAGPGSTNLMTGLYDARIDRAPALAISGQVPSRVKGRGAFQDLDLERAFADVATYGQTIHADSDHAELMSVACKQAIIGRGVAHLVLPDELQTAPSPQRAGGPQGRYGDHRVAPPAGALIEAVDHLAHAERPVFVVGHGARHDMNSITALAERCGAPVLTTFKAKGQISDHHPLGAGVLGRSGTPVASYLMNESDLLVVWGASFSNHTGIAPYKTTIQVDDDPMALGRFHPVDVPVLGDVGVTATAIAAALPEVIAAVDQRTDVAQRWQIWRTEKRSRIADDRGAGVGSAALFDALGRHVANDAVICVDVGNNAYSFGRYFEVDRQSVLMSGYLGSIGFALPAAMGAWAAVSDPGRDSPRQVIAVAGDGGFGQYAMELTTLVRHDMDITVVLLDNGELGKISKEQRAGEFDVWQTDLVNPDFAEFARLCGVFAVRVERRDELDAAIVEALRRTGPSLVHVRADVALI